jgi:hypothetical protein
MFLNIFKHEYGWLLIMKVITAVVNNPTFIEMQYHTLKKYLKGVDTYEFIVFNDAKPFPDFTNDGDLSLVEKIAETCRVLNVQCIPIPNGHHKQQLNAATRCADSMNYILQYQLKHPDQYLLLDSDMFLIDYFDMNKYFKYECAVLLQSRFDSRLNYIWNGIYYFDIPKMKNLDIFNWNPGKGGDVGAMAEEWLKREMGGAILPKTDDLRWKKNETFHTDTIYFIPHLWSTSWNANELPDNLKPNKALLTFMQEDVRNVNGNFYCEIYDKVFLHYRAGSNWNKEGLTLHQDLTRKLKQVLM